jgi:glycosyltransferase involved in cell wall biosynthesis
VVAVDTGAIGEMVVDGDTGLLVPPDDGPAVRAAIEHLLADAGLRATMGAAGSARVVEHYDADVSAERLLALLTSIVGAAPPAAAQIGLT